MGSLQRETKSCSLYSLCLSLHLHVGFHVIGLLVKGGFDMLFLSLFGLYLLEGFGFLFRKQRSLNFGGCLWFHGYLSYLFLLTFSSLGL